MQGDRFTKNEATEVFFSVTRLFQSKDVSIINRDVVNIASKKNCRFLF